MGKKNKQASVPAGQSAGQSQFTGGAFANYWMHLAVYLVSLITLGLAYPAMYCKAQRWTASHTYIDGKQMEFDGKGGELFKKFIIWGLLSFITLGIYFIVKGQLLMEEWVTSHTHFVGEKSEEEGKQSKFNGKWYQLFGVNLLTGFVSVITLSFGSYWAHCYKERWFCKHRVIDGQEMCFDGTAMQYFGKRIVWWLLTAITLGGYSFWLAVKSKQWTISHTHLVAAPAPAVAEAAPATDVQG